MYREMVPLSLRLQCDHGCGSAGKSGMLLSDITAQGNRIAQHMDIRDMKNTAV